MDAHPRCSAIRADGTPAGPTASPTRLATLNVRRGAAATAAVPSTASTASRSPQSCVPISRSWAAPSGASSPASSRLNAHAPWPHWRARWRGLSPSASLRNACPRLRSRRTRRASNALHGSRACPHSAVRSTRGGSAGDRANTVGRARYCRACACCRLDAFARRPRVAEAYQSVRGASLRAWSLPAWACAARRRGEGDTLGPTGAKRKLLTIAGRIRRRRALRVHAGGGALPSTTAPGSAPGR